MRRTITWLVIANVWSLIGSAASAEIISLYPVSERSAWDRTTVGSNGIYDGLYDGWYDGTGIGVLAFHGVIDYEIRGAMEFDIRPVSAEATVRSALLFVTTDPGHGDVPLIQLYVEGYAGNGTVELGDMAASNRVATVTYAADDLNLSQHTLDVTALVQTLNEAGAGWAGFTLHTTPGVTIGVAGGDSPLTAWRPHLDIEFDTVAVPEPETKYLLLFGLACFTLCCVHHYVHRHRWRCHVS